MNNPIKRPLVSICCVTFNQSLYIEKCLDGFDLQLCNFDFEVLIFDDASTDDNQQRILRHAQDKKNYRLFLQNENQWNKNKFGFIDYLIPAANGKYIALCEGDDYWTDPYKLQKQVDFLEANPDYVLSFHKIKILKPNGELVEDFITKVPENYETQETLARLGNYIHTPSVVFRNVIKEFPPEIALTPIGDYFLYMLLAEQGKLKYIDEEMAVYRYGVGVISKMNNFKIAYNNIKMYSCMIGAVKEVKIKIIFMKRQEEALSLYKSTFDIKDSFIIKIPFFLIYLKDRSKEFIFNPRKSLRRIKNKIKQVFSK